MKNMGVIGAGTMGSGIAQVFASSGWQVRLCDVDREKSEGGKKAVVRRLAKQVEKGKLPAEQAGSIADRISPRGDLSNLDECEIVVEASLEEMAVKKGIFSQLSHVTSGDCILASNTSSLSISEIASCVSGGERVAGMHFFNPAPVMALVEVVRGAVTSEATVRRVFEIARAVGKTPVLAAESPGFIVNRILVPMINEAAGLLAEGVSEAADIDTAMKLGCNHPIGPLSLADMIGVDIVLNVMEVLHYELGDDKYRPHPILRKMVRAGRLGVKSKRGFFEY